MSAPVLPCPRHGPTHPCRFQEQDAGPCTGQIRAYYLNWYVTVYVCEGHLAGWQALWMALLPSSYSPGDSHD
jgi:hypothetical protein